MQFNFLHRPTRKKERRPWYENALLLAVAGSIIAFIGQLSGTLIPISFGPADISDYSISISPIASEIYLDENETSEWKYFKDYRSVKTNISVKNFHKYLRPYRYNVALKISDSELPPCDDSYVEFKPPEISPESKSQMTIALKNPKFNMEKLIYPIRIQGLGGDGRKQNTTYYISIFPTRPEKPPSQERGIAKHWW
jgi:hypothetical protein